MGHLQFMHKCVYIFVFFFVSFYSSWVLLISGMLSSPEITLNSKEKFSTYT